MIKRILQELKHHIPFTAFGAVTGIILMFIFRNVPQQAAYKVFYTFHPAHVLLSALVTSAMYKLHRAGHLKIKLNIFVFIIIGYTGSVGIGTISDSLIPYLGEMLLNMPNRHAHIGFIEEWWIVNPLALAGIAIGYFFSKTKIPHACHIFVSTWASLFHIIMAANGVFTRQMYVGIFFFLFIAVWLPCCTSDIVFPLLFVRGQGGKECCPEGAHK